jgi:hypothetical protein
MNGCKSSLNPSASVFLLFTALPIVKRELEVSGPEAAPQTLPSLIEEAHEDQDHAQNQYDLSFNTLSPYSLNLLGQSLLEAMDNFGDGTPSLDSVETIDDGSPIDSGYESGDQGFFRYVLFYDIFRHLASCRR